MKSKPVGHSDLKTLGMDGFWLPRGHFGEMSFTCSNGHVLTHDPLVAPPHITIHKKGQAMTKALRAIRADMIVTNVDGIVKYSWDKVAQVLTITCPTDGEVLATIKPNINFKNFDGDLTTHFDGQVL